MWYEVLPSFAIIAVALTLPGYALHYMQKGLLGNAYKRVSLEPWDQLCAMRDDGLTGDKYKVNGLNSLPDE